FSETSSEEADSSDISKPATKVIRIDDSPKSSFSDKCIQVNAEEEYNEEQVNQVEGNLNDEEIIINFVSVNSHSASSSVDETSYNALTSTDNPTSTNQCE